MPDSVAFLDERRLSQFKTAEPGARGWHDRKLPDGDVPEKIKKIAGWKRAMKDFMNSDPKLNDLVNLFTQKFVQMGQSRNFTLSTLLDLAWTVLILTWEAVINDRLPMMDEVERGFKEKYEDLQKTVMDMRMQYLAEITEHRDRIRNETLSAPMQVALAEINDSEESGDHAVYRFQPEVALDAATMDYFKAAMQENMKVALTKGAAAAGETIQLLMSQLKDAQTEMERLKEQLEDALLQAKLNEVPEKRVIQQRRTSVPPSVDDTEVKKLQAELEQMKAEAEAKKKDMDRFCSIFQIFGLDVNASVEDARSFFESLTAPSEDPSEANKLRAQNAALLKTQKKLEEEIEQFKKKNLEETCRKLQQQVQDLEEEMQKLKKMSTQTMPAGKDKGKDDLSSRNADLEKQLALLKKQMADQSKGKDVVADLMKRNEELEAEIEKLRTQLSKKDQELASSTKAADVARRQSTDLMAQLDAMRKDLENAKKELAEERRRSSTRPPPESDGGEETERAAKLQEKLRQSRQEVEVLKQENQQLRDALDEAKIMRKALEQAMEELRRKFEDFKKRLQEKGVDVRLLDEALAEAGMPLHPMNVFDRLYQDAVRRFNRFQEKWVIDMRNAQQETWERILGIYDGPPLSREQVTALVKGGLLDVRRFAFDDAPALSSCPNCGANLRAATPERLSFRPHSQPSEARRPKLERMRTWGGALSMPKGTTYTSAEALTSRRDLYLDIVGFHPNAPQERKAFAIVSEADQYHRHMHLQRFDDSPKTPKPLVSPKVSERQGTPTTPGKELCVSPTKSRPKLAAMDTSSAMSMDLTEPEVAPPPLAAPVAPPVAQRRVSAQKLEGKGLKSTASAFEPFTAVISGSKALPLPQIASAPQIPQMPMPQLRSGPKGRSRSPTERPQKRLSRTESQPQKTRREVDISISGIAASPPR